MLDAANNSAPTRYHNSLSDKPWYLAGRNGAPNDVQQSPELLGKEFSAYHALGFSVIPLQDRSKIASGSWKAQQSVRFSEPTCRSMDGKGYNVGIVTGSISGIFVIDIDGEEGFQTLKNLELEYGILPKTACTITSSGMHFYFKLPAGEQSNIRNLSSKGANGQVMPKVDVRGEGGYVVAPPSIHPSGHEYRWYLSPWEVEIAEVPEGWLDLLIKRAPEPTPPATYNHKDKSFVSNDRKNAYLNKVIDDELSQLSQAQQGERNAQLNRSAFALSRLVHQGLDESYLRAELEKTALAIGLQHGEIVSTIDSAFTAGMANPRTDITDKVSSDDNASVMSVDEPSVQEKIDWPEPTLPKHELHAVPDFDMSLMPEPLRPWLTDVTERMQCAPEYVAAGAMTAISAIVGARCCILPKQYDASWFVIPNLWGMIVGNPSTMKTPTLNQCLQPIRKLESEAREDNDEAMKKYQRDVKIFKMKEDSIFNEMAKLGRGSYKGTRTINDLQDELDSLDYQEKPKWKRYHTNDATVEKLAEILSENPQGVLVFRDELVGLLKTWEKEGHASDRAFFLEGWNGWGQHTTDRIGRGTIHTENVCLSLIGGTQPSRLRQYLYQYLRSVGNDGLMQRFQLLVYPDPPKKWKLVDRLPDQNAQQRFERIITKLASMDFAEHGAFSSNSNKPPAYQFDDDAQPAFFEWLYWLENEKLNDNTDSLMNEHITKYRSLIPSLALLFHLIHIADETATTRHVSVDCIELAIKWGHLLEAHAERVYRMATDMSCQSAMSLVRRLQKGELEDGFTLRELYRKGWNHLAERELAESACDELVRLGWLREETNASKRGGPHKTIYRINPKIKTGRV